MRIEKKSEDNKLTVGVIGKLDTNTAPELEASVNESIDGVKELVFDFSELNYISSAGLRVVLIFHKLMTSKAGKLVIYKPNDDVMDIFDMTGFSTFLNIKE